MHAQACVYRCTYVYRAVSIAPLAECFLFSKLVRAVCAMERSEEFMLAITFGYDGVKRHCLQFISDSDRVRYSVRWENQRPCVCTSVHALIPAYARARVYASSAARR